MLPYWEGVDVEEAIDYIVDKMDRLEAAFPGKRIIIGEVGWPSDGRTREQAVASPANEALFLRRFIARAKQEKYVYYVMEAFDQPWKSAIEGSVGAYWGVFDVNRQAEVRVRRSPIIRIPEWHVLAGVSVVISALLLGGDLHVQRLARHARPQFPGRRRVHHGHDHRPHHLRLLAEVPDAHRGAWSARC